MSTQIRHKLILGIDPGIERLGWGLVEKSDKGEYKAVDSGVKKTSAKLPTSKRILEIYEFLDDLIKKTSPEAASIEKLFFAANAKTALTVGEARGAILAVCERNALDIREFTPLEVKTAVCGYGKAGKKEVAQMLEYSVALPPKKMLDDETDAIALALTAFVHKGF